MPATYVDAYPFHGESDAGEPVVYTCALHVKQYTRIPDEWSVTITLGGDYCHTIFGESREQVVLLAAIYLTN